MKKFFAFILAIIFTLTSLNVSAQELPAIQTGPEDSATLLISPLKKSQKAPFNGVLLNPAAVAGVKVQLDTADEQCKIEQDKAVGICKAQCDFNSSNLKAENERLAAVAAANEKSLRGEITDLQATLKKTTTSGSNPVLLIGLGVVGGVLTTLGTVWVVGQISK